MQFTTKFVGLDVSKEKIAVAIAEAGREEPRFYGTIPHTPEALGQRRKEAVFRSVTDAPFISLA